MFNFAHSDDFHSESTANWEHLITSPWFAIPLTIALFALIIIVLHKYTRLSDSSVFVILMALLLIVGLGTINLIPALSILCIGFGMMLALVSVLLMVGRG